MGLIRPDWSRRAALAALAALLIASQPVSAVTGQPSGAIEGALAKYVVFLTEKIPVSQDVTAYDIVFTPSGIVYVNVGLYKQDPSQMVNALVLETFSLFLINADTLGLSGETEKLAMARQFGTAIADYLNHGGLWFGNEGNIIEIDPASTGILRALLWATTAGLLSPDDPKLISSLSALISAQKQDGGWPINPVNPSAPSFTQSNPLVTAHVLSVLIRAYSLGMGKRVSGLTSSINKAIDYLEGGAIRSGGEVYWNEVGYRGFTKDRLEVTAEVSDALARAALQGFDVDQSILAGAAKYLISYISMYQPDWDVAVPILHTLLRMSSLGIIDTKEVKVHARMYIDIILENQDPDSGLWSPPGSLGDILTSLIFSSEIARFLLDWSKISTIDLRLSAAGLGYYDTYDPPRLVEGGELKVSLSVLNEAPYSRMFAVEVRAPPDMEVVSNTTNPFDVSAYGNGSYVVTLRAAGAVEGLTTLRLTFLLKDAASGTVLFTRYFTVALARIGRLEILSKTVTPANVSLGGVVTVSVSMRNRGDVPVEGCVIREILGEGFELLAQGANYSEVAQAATTGYPYLSFIEPDQTISYTYVVRASNAPPGTVLLSRTSVEYSDALGNPRNVTRESTVTVLRPLVYLELNSSEVEMQWGEARRVSVSVSNDGNAPSKEIVLLITGIPDASISVVSYPPNSTVTSPSTRERRVEVGPLEPGETISLVLEVKANSIYFTPRISDVITVSMKYSDPAGQFFKGFSENQAFQVTVVMSKTFKILLAALGIIVALLLVIRIRSWSRERGRQARARYYRRRVRRPPRRLSRTRGSLRGI